MPYAKSAPLSLMALLRAIRRPIASAVLVTFTLSPYGALAGATPDIGAAPQNQASVTHAGTVPVVSIVAPDADGLSHNKWQQFDVPTQGMVLNNATAATHTTLVGTLGANPNLAGGAGAAQVILNEVTSNQPSSLLGTLEVAGQSARVIIANPNGITCDGCGFINTPHVQLTTGRPGFDNGALRFDVTGGQIDIGASGLSVLATRLDLIAHTLRTQGAISTQADLNLIAGRFYAKAETLTLTDAGRSGLGPFPYPAASYAIDIGQSVSADSIQLITSGGDIGVRTVAPVAAFTDLTIASRKTLALGGTLTAGRDIGIYNTGGWSSEITGQLTAQRDLQIIAMDLSVAASGSLRTTTGNIELGFIGDNSDAHTQFINHGTVTAAGDLSFGNVLTGLNTGTLSAGGTIDAALSAVSPKIAAASLPGAFGETFYAQFGAGPGAQLANTGTVSAGQDLYFNLIENDGGSLSAGRDAFVWQAQRGQFAGAYQTPQHRAGSVSTMRDLFVFAPGDRNEFTSPGTQSFNAAGNLYLLPEADRFNPPSDLRTTLLADLSAPSPSGTARYINRDIFDATGDLSITLPAGFENQKTLHGRDIRISATEVINTAQIDTQHAVVRYQGTPVCDGSNASNCVPIMFAPDSPEPYPGCKTNYTGTCTTDTEVVASTALIEADRDLIIDSPVFSNVGATTLAGGYIDIATNDFFNGQRDYQATWSAEYSAKPFQQAFSGTSCTTCEASIDWSRTAAGTVPLGSIAGNIQAGNVFSVDTLPRSGQPAVFGNTSNSTPPVSGPGNTTTPSADASSVTAILAQAVTQGPGSVGATPPALSKFINTGNINAAAIVVKADDIRNGFDTVKDYYQRTAAPQLPPSTIAVANYGTAGTLGAGGYSGAALMQVLPPNLASSAPFALTPAEEQAALRNAFLATTGRAWILPGLTWDSHHRPVPGRPATRHPRRQRRRLRYRARHPRRRRTQPRPASPARRPGAVVRQSGRIAHPHGVPARVLAATTDQSARR
ncbi:filamentous hemagglutinin N-terminal domain-containing protein [Denitromonas sp.]|uniref:filamentous hemagglutinin N-terminal domain-containing protein n=1 Tax=Denitromonas sp. TaxID=2734609 RepID=UPI003A86BB14